MKTLLVINDSTPQGDHAAKFALIIAQALQANILIANACKSVKPIQKEKAYAGNEENDELSGHYAREIAESLIKLNNHHDGFKPEITEVDISAFNEVQLAEFSNKEQIWMIVKGMADHSPETLSQMHIDINVLLNRVRCPLLMVL